jgi:Flp pilus assembly protein CpaB
VATRFAVVAAKAMPSGTFVTKDSVKLVPWPVKNPLTVFDKIEDVVGRPLIAGVVENEPVTELKLAPGRDCTRAGAAAIHPARNARYVTEGE